MPTKTHIHKYERINIADSLDTKTGKQKKHLVFKCRLPNCTHYLSKKQVIGMLSICWRCGNIFQMTVKTLLKKPHCISCTKSEKEEVVSEDFVQDFLEGTK